MREHADARHVASNHKLVACYSRAKTDCLWRTRQLCGNSRHKYCPLPSLWDRLLPVFHNSSKGLNRERCMRHVVAAVALSLCALAAFAQTDRGTITGTITDPAGAVIANAPIEAKNNGTGAVYPAATSGTGNYTIAQLPIGTYDLSV